MKLRLPFLLLITVPCLFLPGASCTHKSYSPNSRLSYKRSERIRVYKKPLNRKTFTHKAPVMKKYIIK